MNQTDLNTILVIISLGSSLIYYFIIRARYEKKKVKEQERRRKLKEKELEENGIEIDE